jgi:hypothetical protein
MRKAAARKKGSENTIRNVNSVSASICVSANAFLTMIAFVEKRIAPMIVIINPKNRLSFSFLTLKK